jgi:hypothetical protein
MCVCGREALAQLRVPGTAAQHAQADTAITELANPPVAGSGKLFLNIAGVGIGYQVRHAKRGTALFAEAAVLTLPFIGGITGSKQFVNFYPNARLDARLYYRKTLPSTQAADPYLAWAVVFLYNPYGSVPTTVQGAAPEPGFTGNRFYALTGPAWGFMRRFDRRGYLDVQVGVGIAATQDVNGSLRYLPLPNLRVAVGIAK